MPTQQYHQLFISRLYHFYFLTTKLNSIISITMISKLVLQPFQKEHFGKNQGVLFSQILQGFRYMNFMIIFNYYLGLLFSMKGYYVMQLREIKLYWNFDLLMYFDYQYEFIIAYFKYLNEPFASFNEVLKPIKIYKIYYIK